MILVTGASGFVGKTLVNRMTNGKLLIAGRTKPEFCSDVNFRELNIDSKSDYSMQIRNVTTIIHLAARVHAMDDNSNDALAQYREVNTSGTINLARQAALTGVKRFIFISSIKVNGESTLNGHPFTHDCHPKPQDFYGISKFEAEEKLLQLAEETGLEVVIIRPTLIYGPGVKANFASLLNLASKGIPLPFGCINKNKRSLVSVENLVDLILTCIDHPKAVNQIFLISDDNDVSTASILREMFKALEKPNRLLPIPLWCYHLAGKLFRKQEMINRLLGSLQVDISHTKETLNWVPPQTLQDGFKETAKAFLKNKENICSD